MATHRGIAFPFQKGKSGYPAMVEDEECVWNDVKLLFATSKRSRVMKPSLGTRLQALVFENTGALLNAKIYREIVTAVANFEPRAFVSSLTVSDNGTTVTIDTVVTIRGISKTISTSFSRSGE